MKEALEFIINSLLGDSSTQILEEEKNDQFVFTIKPTQENIGKILGKKGKIINAIRKLLKIRSAKEGKQVFLNIESDYGLKGSTLSAPPEKLGTSAPIVEPG